MIGLISCGAKKLDRAAPARELYTSTLFRLSLAYAERYCSRVYVLSAKHGLLKLDESLSPYDQRLSERRDQWARRVTSSIMFWNRDVNEEILLLAGASYVAPLVAALRDAEWDGDIILPLAGLQIGERLRFLSRANKAAA